MINKNFMPATGTVVKSQPAAPGKAKGKGKGKKGKGKGDGDGKGKGKKKQKKGKKGHAVPGADASESDHPQPAAPGTPLFIPDDADIKARGLCYYHQKGTCTKGNDCKWEHSYAKKKKAQSKTSSVYSGSSGSGSQEQNGKKKR